MGRCLEDINQCLARALSLQTPEVFCRNDYHFIPPMHGDVLRPVASDTSHQLTETRLGILKQPVSRWRGWTLGW